MTPPSDRSPLALAALAAALGVTVGVVPARLLAQSTQTTATAPASAEQLKVDAKQTKQKIDATQTKQKTEAIQGKVGTEAIQSKRKTEATQSKVGTEAIQSKVEAVQEKQKAAPPR